MLSSVSQVAAFIANKDTTPVVCDPVVPFKDFDVSRFAGLWYEQMHVVDPQEPSYYQCSTAEYTDLSPDADLADFQDFKVYNSFQSKVLGIWGPRIGVHPKAKCGPVGDCYVSFAHKAVPTPNLSVLDTDYENYAIEYWCDTESNLVRLWIETREPVVSEEYWSQLYAHALSLVPSFDESTFMPRVTHGDMCSYHHSSSKLSDLVESALF